MKSIDRCKQLQLKRRKSREDRLISSSWLDYQNVASKRSIARSRIMAL